MDQSSEESVLRLKERNSESACSSEDSDGDDHSSDQMKAIRKVSTRRQLRKKKCLKEGMLLKQTGSSFQRWKSRYFKLRGCRLYYAKTEDSEIFNELDLKGCSVAENSHKNINCSFSVIGSTYQLILCADTRKAMDEWITAIRAQKNHEYYSPDQSALDCVMDGHNWYACAHSRPTYCNVCREALSGVTNHGLSCDVCTFKAHKKCASRAVGSCKWSNLSSVGKNIVENDEGIYIVHQWLEGNLPVNAKCVVCEKTCGSVLRLQDWKCLWCKSVVHTNCKSHMPSRCSLGPCRHSIVTPTAIHSYDSNGFWMALPSQQCASPLLVFVNSRSGDNQGVKFLRRFRQYLNPAQVFDLACCGPKSGLKMFQKFETIRVLICSGDGSIGWVLNEVDQCNLINKMRVGVLPLGTGNDLAQVMGWGNTCDDDIHVQTIIERYERASVKLLDRWSVLTYERETFNSSTKSSTVMAPTLGKEECEATVADHLSIMLNSDQHAQVISSASALCKTIKNFVSTIEHGNEDDEMALKYQTFDEKVTSLLDTLRQEWQQAVSDGKHQQMFRPAADFLHPASSTGDVTTATTTSLNDDVITPAAATSSSPLKSGNVASSRMAASAADDITTTTSSSSSFRLSKHEHDMSEVENKKKLSRRQQKKATFKVSSQVMLRANSLKKAMRRIMDHTEKILDEQNQLSPTAMHEDKLTDEKEDNSATSGQLYPINELETLHAAGSVHQQAAGGGAGRKISKDSSTTTDDDDDDVIQAHDIDTSSHQYEKALQLSTTTHPLFVNFLQSDKKKLLVNPLYSHNGRASFIERALMSNAQAVCAPATPLCQATTQLLNTTEKCAMNNYFGIGLDAKIALEFHRRREEHPKKFSRIKNRMWYTMLGAKELAVRTFKNLEQRIKLECDGETILLPPLQGIVILNIPSYMGGANFWGTKTANDIFIAPSYNDKLLEVMAVFSSRHLGMAIVVPDGVLQHHRIAQCRSVRITVLGDEAIPLEVDGEAWMQPPGVITIQHKNTIQMLARDRRFETTLKSWEEKQRNSTCNLLGGGGCSGVERTSDSDIMIIAELVETVSAVSSGIIEAMKECGTLHNYLNDLINLICEHIGKIQPHHVRADDASHQSLIYVVTMVRDLNSTLHNLLSRNSEISGNEAMSSKIYTWLEWLEMEMNKLHNVRWLAPLLQKDHKYKVSAKSSMTSSHESAAAPSSSARMVTSQSSHVDEPSCSLVRKAASTTTAGKSSKFGVFTPLFKKSSSKKDGQKNKLHATNPLNLYDVIHWNVGDVGTWLESLHLDDYTDAFVKNDVQGKELLRLETSDIKEIGVTKIGHVKRLQAAIRELQLKNC